MASSELRWHRIDKFGGLWDVKPTTLMPPNAAQIMSGCHPQPVGGLRAFFRPREWATTAGLGRTGAALRVIGVYPIEGNAFLVTAPVDTAVATDAVRPPNGEARAYVTLSDGTGWAAAVTGLGGATTRSLFIPSLGFTGGSLTPEHQFGKRYTAIQQLSAGNGVYSMDEATGAFAPEAFTNPTSFFFMLEHQARLIAGYESSIVFTSPGEVDFPTTGDPTQFVNLGGRPVMWALPLPPNDLLVGTDNGAIYNIQGPLDDPYVRTVKEPGTGAIPGRGQLIVAAALTESGPVASGPTGPFLVSTDGTIRRIAPGLRDDHFRLMYRSTGSEGGFTMATAGDFLFVRSDGLYQNELDRRIRFLTTGDPDGTIRDTAFAGAEVWPTDMATWIDEHLLELNGLLTFDTKAGAWFRSVHPDVADFKMPWHVAYNPGQEGNYEQGQILGIPTEEFDAVTDQRLGYGVDVYGPRQHTWEWKSAPFHSDDGRVTRLREVQLGAYGHTNTGAPEVPSTIVVTAENEHGQRTGPITVQIQPGVSQVYDVPIRCDGTYVTVTLKAVSSDGQHVEAPTLEYLSLGFAGGATDRQKGSS